MRVFEPKKTLTQVEDILRNRGTINLEGVNLNGINLSDMDLSGYNFRFCILQGAIFCRSNIESCNFLNSDLDRANFSNVQINNQTDFRGASIRMCRIDDNTIQASKNNPRYNGETGRIVENNGSYPIPFELPTPSFRIVN